MKQSIRVTLVMAAAVFAAGAVMAVEPTDMDGVKTANGKLIKEYFDMRFGQCKTTEADKKYYHAQAIEHGWLGNGGGVPGAGGGAPPPGAGMPPPAAAAGGPPPGGGMAPAGGMAPGGKCEPIATMLKLMVQGDLVFVQAHGHQSKPNGDLLWVLYRIKDGKIYEHWDTHNEIPNGQVGKQW